MVITAKNIQQKCGLLFKSLTYVALSVSFASVAADTAEIGSTLNQKFEVSVDEVPAEIMQVIKDTQPDFIAKEAEKELKHGKTYFDIEGEKADGSVIEFDLLLVDGQWTIMEIQRDLTLTQCPPEVVTAYQNKTDLKPDRIIESKQSTGEVIYEFYTMLTNGKEVKREVKFNEGKAEVLKSEWKH